MNLFKLSHILVKHLKGRSTNEDVEMIEKWANSDPKNQSFLTHLNDANALSNELDEYNQFDCKKAWSKFEGQHAQVNKKASFILPLLRIASIIVLFVALGGVIYYINLQFDDHLLAEDTTIEPGGLNAVLHVAGSRAIVLTDTTQAQINEGAELIANVDDGQITYSTHAMEPQQMTIEVPLRSEYQFVLADGTQVMMNAGSKLQFSHPFDSDNRTVSAEGEVYFSVHKDETKPFIVQLPNGNQIQVLGTEFNVNAYPDEINQRVVLAEGSVVWRTQNKMERILEPGQLLSMNVANGEIDVKEVDTYAYLAWKEGRFVYEGEKLGDIMLALSRWYGVSVSYEDEALKNLHFSMDVRRYENLRDILDMLELTEKVRFTINGSDISISMYK